MSKARRGSVAVALTQKNMEAEIQKFNRFKTGDPLSKAPAKLDPNSSMRRLNINAANLGSYNSLYSLGNIRQTQKDRTIKFTTDDQKNGKSKFFTMISWPV